MTKSRWGITMTADEPEQLVLANVGWHLATGASEVHVYLDRPGDPVAETLRAVPGVFVTITDDAYWAKIGKGLRPAIQTQRQFHNANGALAKCGVDWLAHVDADEFLFQHRPLSLELPYVHELGCELHFPVSERFHVAGEPVEGLFDGVFRRTTGEMVENFDRHIFGAHRKYLSRGMLGHSGGKAAVPTDSDFILGIHSSHKGRKGPEHRSKRFRSTTTRVLHFDGLTPRHWLLKIAIKSMRADTGKFPKSRMNQMIDFLEHYRSRDAVLAYHNQLRVLQPEDVARMDGFGILEPERFDPTDKITQALGFCPDLSVATFDKGLQLRYPELCAEYLLADPSS